MKDAHGVVRSADDGAVGTSVARSSGHSESSRGRREVTASPHAGRFRSITALLVALGIGAIVVAVAVAINGRDSAPAGAKWSQWQPPDGGSQGACNPSDETSCSNPNDFSGEQIFGDAVDFVLRHAPCRVMIATPRERAA